MRRLLPYAGLIPMFVFGCLLICLFTGSAVGNEDSGGGGLGAAPSGHGLVGTYTDGQRTVVVRVDTPNFYLEPGESLHPALEPAFDAEWTGFISILEGGRYTFRGGQAEVHLRGRRLTTSEVDLDSGHYAVLIRYRRLPGTARLELRWRSEHFPEEPVPSSVFFHSGESEELRAQTTVERGRFLIEEYGCINCHVTESPSLVARRGPDLSRIGSRVGMSWIFHWLGEPTSFRPGAAMPALLNDAGRRDVAAYLATLGRSERRESETVTPHEIGKGRELYESIGCHACHDIPELSLTGMGSKMSPAALADYLMDPGQVDPDGRMPSLMLTAAEARSLSAFLVQSRHPKFEEVIPNVLDGDPEEGKRLVRARGCLECHDLEPPDDPATPDDLEPLVSTFGAPPLERLGSTGGCLATEPGLGTPRYRLTHDERVALGAFITSWRDTPDVSVAPVHANARRLGQLRCTACHRRDTDGPVVRILDRVPTLAGIGAKLKSTWIDQVLTNQRRVRPELRLRMPHYPTSLVKPLATSLAASDGIGPTGSPEGTPEGIPEGDVTRRPARPDALTDRQSAGVDMIGSDGARGGLSCIACHDHGEYRPIADEKGPQTIGTTERLRFEWFRRWMHNPGRIISGTSMPTYFSGRSAEEADEGIARLWAALSLGSDMPRPYGVGNEMAASGDEAFPTPTHTAVVVRFPLPGTRSALAAPSTCSLKVNGSRPSAR